MMRTPAVLVILTALVGCSSYIEIFEVAAEKGDQEEVAIRFKARQDVTKAAQFYGAQMAVVSQLDPRQEGADRVLDHGHAGVGAGKLVRLSESTDDQGTIYAFRASFPLKGQYVYDKPVWFSHEKVPIPYDLTTSGRHQIEFWSSGGMCGGPGGYHTNRVRVDYQAP